MSSKMTAENSSIHITKMVNDLFLQWLSLPDTRATLSSALHSVRTNSKMPDPIVYSKIQTIRGSAFSKSQPFDSPPVSPVPRTPSSPRISSSTNLSFCENVSSTTTVNNEDKQQRSSKKSSTVANGNVSTTTLESPQVSVEKHSKTQTTKSESVESAPSTSGNNIVTRSSITPTNESLSKQSQQTRPQSTTITQEQPSKPTVNRETTSIESIPNVETSQIVTGRKKPTLSTSTTEQSVSKPTLTPKLEEKSKTTEIIPTFYFPDGQTSANSTNNSLITKQLRQVKDELFSPKHDKINFEDFGKLSQLIGLSLYWKTPLFRSCAQDALGTKTNVTPTTTITYSQFETFWKKVCKTNHDNALKFIYLLIHSTSTPTNRPYLTVDDWDYLVQDIIDTHPGLKFLREAREFHSRYIKTVVARVYYTCNRSWSTRLTAQEIRRSNFLQTFDQLEREEDINNIHDYFSYEHFYVIYCKFWELDSDHDLFINRDDLAKHNSGAVSNKMIDRIFSGAVSNSQNIKEGKMSYYEFVWFLISEEDKRSQTSIEYWFRCMDLDGDGILSMYELEYFYQEQVHKMEIYGIEYMSFEDCICQMFDLVKPEEENKIRLKDLKRCKLTNVFFDTFFNLEKYLNNEQKDPFSNVKDPDTPEESDWVQYANAEYENLTHEDGVTDNGDDINYDEDFEDEDDGDEKATNQKSNNNNSSSSQRVGPGSNKRSEDF